MLGFREGATENAEVAKTLLEDLVARGVSQCRKRLFVIDGSKALRKAIDQVFGEQNPVQRCRDHKLRNVVGHLPKDQHDQARATLKAAFKLEADEGMSKIEQYASWLERDWPAAAASLREGFSELFTINRLGLPSALRRCLGTTNLIDNSHAALRERTRRVKHWQNGTMALRFGVTDTVDSTKRKAELVLGAVSRDERDSSIRLCEIFGHEFSAFAARRQVYSALFDDLCDFIGWESGRKIFDEVLLPILAKHHSVEDERAA